MDNEGNVSPGFQHGLERARFKAGMVGGKGLIYAVTTQMKQSSRLEKNIAKVEEDVPIDLLEYVFLLEEMSDDELELLGLMGYVLFTDYEYKERPVQEKFGFEVSEEELAAVVPTKMQVGRRDYGPGWRLPCW